MNISKRNKPRDPVKTMEALLKNFEEHLHEENTDFEALAFTISRLQRIALTAIADPQSHIATTSTAVEQALALKHIARRALDAIETLEQMIKYGTQTHPDPSWRINPSTDRQSFGHIHIGQHNIDH